MIKELKKEQRFITVEDSKIIYGVAILLMIFHHCFCIPERLNYDYIAVIGNFELESRIAYIGKLCVAFYAFITGYALAVKSEKNQSSSFFGKLKSDAFISLKQAKNFYTKFWLVAIVFLIIGVFFFDEKYTPFQLVNYFFKGVGINMEWWYVWRYLTFLIYFVPLELFVYYISKNHFVRNVLILLAIGIVSLLGIRLFLWDTAIKTFVLHKLYSITSNYLFIFFLGFLISKFKIFEMFYKKIKIPVLLYPLFIVICLVLRLLYIKTPASNNYDIILTPILIYSILAIAKSGKISKYVWSVLKFLGKYSIYMWLIHTFWIYYYFQNIILLPRYSILIYIWSVLISLANAIVFDYIYKFIFINKFRLKAKKNT